jgi:hypothetical protein
MGTECLMDAKSVWEQEEPLEMVRQHSESSR